ncbi:MAG: hypothetical protein MUP81_06195 [Dehalococcoidia bacterium]|nr:hypothetical protein [Dehalococcoidia bacterium]
MGTISNVLVGVATLAIKSPYSEAIAQFSTEQAHAGTYSAKLYKDGTGNACSTHVQLTPPAGTTVALWTAGIANNSFWHHSSAVLGNFAQFEFRFEDPNSAAWLEITALPLQTYLGTGAWVQKALIVTEPCGYGGVGELGASFFNFGPLTAANAVQAAVDADAAVGTCADWILSRVRIELWEPTPLRTCYIDTVEIMGVTYTIEPGGTAPAMSLDPGYTELGYTKDGVTMDYTSEDNEIYVEEETWPIKAPLAKQGMRIKANLAESSLFNLDKAMAGASLSGNIITFPGIQKEMALRVIVENPANYKTAYYFPLVVATGTVSMPFKKAEETTLPVEFKVLKSEVTIVYNAA